MVLAGEPEESISDLCDREPMCCTFPTFSLSDSVISAEVWIFDCIRVWFFWQVHNKDLRISCRVKKKRHGFRAMPPDAIECGSVACLGQCDGTGDHDILDTAAS